MALAGLTAFSSSALIANGGKQKDTVERGGANPPLVALYDVQGIVASNSLLGSITAEIADPRLRLALMVANYSQTILGVVGIPVGTLLNTGNYPLISRIPLIGPYLPTELRESTKKCYKTIAKSASTVTMGALLVAGVASPLMGILFGAGLVIPPLYHYIEKKGYVPEPVSNFVERRTPLIIEGASLLGGGPLLQSLILVEIALTFPQVSGALASGLQSLNAGRCKSQHLQGYEQLLAPFKPLKHIDFEDIQYILKTSAYDYVVHHAHCMLPVQHTALELPRSTDFDKLKEFFNRINWKEKLGYIEKELKKDPRFLAQIKTEIEEKWEIEGEEKSVDALSLLANYEGYLEEVITFSEKTKEAYLIDQITHQIDFFIGALKGEEQNDGSVSDKIATKEYAEQILGYLLTLEVEKKENQIIYEDILKQLTVEGGEYCWPGLHRTTRSIVEGIKRSILNTEVILPHIQTEIEIHYTLSDIRKRIFNNTLISIQQEIVQSVGAEAPSLTTLLENAGEMHNQETLEKVLGLGFLPITEEERAQIQPIHSIMWSSTVMPILRKKMYEEYIWEILFFQRYEGSTFIDETKFNDLFLYLINSNESLTEEEKDQIKTWHTPFDDEDKFNPQLNEQQNKNAFWRVVLVMLGVLKLKDKEFTELSGWEEIKEEEGKKIPEEEMDRGDLEKQTSLLMDLTGFISDAVSSSVL